MKKKVLFVMSTLNTGGAQKIISNIIMALPKEWEIDILLNDSEDISYPYRGRIIDLHMKPTLNKRKLSYQLQILWRRYHILRKLKRENGYAACISAMDSANFVNVLTGNKYCKTIPTIHGYHSAGWAPKLVEPLANWLVGKTMKRADHVVAVSQGLENEMIQKFHVPSKKVVTIYNGYDRTEILNKKDATVPKLPWEEAAQIIVTSGRMEKVKGQWHLIKAFSLIEKKNPKARLLILGDGQLRTELEELVHRFHLEEKVYMPGFVDNPFAYLAQSDVFVMTSLSEGYPNAMAEAMICGVPCVSCDCEAGPREILAETCIKQVNSHNYVKAKYGILTPAFDTEDVWMNQEISAQEKTLAEAVYDMLENPQMYEEYAAKTQDKAVALDVNNIISEWCRLIEQVE